MNSISEFVGLVDEKTIEILTIQFIVQMTLY